MKTQTTTRMMQKTLTFSLTIALTILFGAMALPAQTSSVFTTGLNNPAKIIIGGQTSFLVAEAGTTTPNNGRISLVNRNSGALKTLIDGLPSGLSRSGNPNGDAAGPSGVKLVGQKLYLTIGAGDTALPATGGETLNPNPSSPLFNSVLELTLPADYEMLASGFTLSFANQATLNGSAPVTLTNAEGKQLTIRLVVNLPDFVDEPRPALPENIRPANLYGVEISGDSLYIPDASFNLMYRVNAANGTYETFAAFAPKPNPTTTGPPVIETVPDSIRLVGNQFLVPYLTGFPFAPGVSEIRSVNLDTRTQATFIPNLTSAIDVLPINGTGDNDSYLVLEFSRNLLTQQPGQLKFFASRTETPRILIDNLVTPTSFVRDASTGSVFVTENATGRLVRVSVPGDLDTTFGSGGKVVTPATPLDDNATRVRVQSDGKIVTLGHVLAENFMDITAYFIVRHNADGKVDPSFGTNGVVVVNFGSAGNDETLEDFVILPDGRLLVAGGSYAGSSGDKLVLNFVVRRYLADGTLDNSFGTNGVVITTADVNAAATKIVLQPDGKFVIAGYTLDPTEYFVDKVAVARYNADGTLDTAFGTNGITKTSVGNNILRLGEALVQLDGRLLVAGQANFAGNINIFVLRYDVNGTLDNSFGASGIAQTDIDNQLNLVGGMGLQSDGKIVVNGSNFNSNGTALLSSSIVRYNTNGTLDNTFGTNGIVKITEPTQYPIGITTALAIQQNDKILTAGTRNSTYAISRYNSNGTIDTSFGTNGVVVTTVGEAGFDRILALALQPDGKIIAAGGVNNAAFFYDVALVRYLGDAVVQKPSDFDGDGRSDLGVFRPSNGTWYMNRSMQSFYTAQFGISTDKPAPADYDGDGKTDIAVFRENVNGNFAYFYILQSATNTVRIAQFGQTGDDPRVVGDWDGDGKADLAVYRGGGSSGTQSYFYYRPSSQPAVNFIPIQWGTTGDEVLSGDFDGDGKQDAAVFRASNQIWYIRQSSNNQLRYDSWGAASDTRVSGDFDGDGKTDLTVFRNGVWYIKQSSTNVPRYEYWGMATDTLVPADYDGDGKTDVAIFRNGIWYIRQSTGGIRYASFGANGDFPIASFFTR